MTELMDLRSEYKDHFEKKHKVKLGFMSFFVKAVCNALQEIPAVNAEIKDDSIIYKNYCDIGVAVGTEKGLVVPILRDAQNMDLAAIEREIYNYGICFKPIIDLLSFAILTMPASWHLMNDMVSSMCLESSLRK